MSEIRHERTLEDVISTIEAGEFYQDYDQSTADLGILRAALVSGAEQEPVAWLPTATVKWLEEYDGPACGTQTVAHNRPIKSDGGVPVYLAPPSLQAGLEALRKRVAELEKALIECDEYFDNRADADHDGIGVVANEEMKLQMMIRRVREEGRKT